MQQVLAAAREAAVENDVTRMLRLLQAAGKLAEGGAADTLRIMRERGQMKKVRMLTCADVC
jgi:hypothetical protein